MCKKAELLKHKTAAFVTYMMAVFCGGGGGGGGEGSCLQCLTRNLQLNHALSAVYTIRVQTSVVRHSSIVTSATLYTTKT